MIAPMHNLSPPVAPEASGAYAHSAEAIATAFEDLLAALERDAAHQQTAIAFDTCSMFGVMSPTPALDLPTEGPIVAAAPAPLTITDFSAPAHQNVIAGQAPLSGAQRASLSPGPSAERGAPVSRKSPARTLLTSLAASRSNLAGASRAIANVSQSSGSARVRAIPTLRPESLQPIVIAVQETEQGLRIIARTPALDRDDVTELRSEAEALLARHGYRVAELNLATSMKE